MTGEKLFHQPLYLVSVRPFGRFGSTRCLFEVEEGTQNNNQQQQQHQQHQQPVADLIIYCTSLFFSPCALIQRSLND